MAKPVPKSATLDNLATDVRSLTKMVESGFADVRQKFTDVHQKMDKGFADVYRKMDKGFADVRAELSLKADKVDLIALKTDIGIIKDDVSRLSKATKIGFDEVHQEFGRVHQKLETKVNRNDLGEIGEGVEGIRQRFSSLDNRLDTFVTHERRLTELEKLVGVEN